MIGTIRKFRVQIRRDLRAVKPEAERVDGKGYNFEEGWIMDDSDPYPGEVAWLAVDKAWPKGAPIWVAGGDLMPVPENEQKGTVAPSK